LRASSSLDGIGVAAKAHLALIQQDVMVTRQLPGRAQARHTTSNHSYAHANPPLFLEQTGQMRAPICQSTPRQKFRSSFANLNPELTEVSIF
jgi:hypothetical protein